MKKNYFNSLNIKWTQIQRNAIVNQNGAKIKPCLNKKLN